MVWPRQPIAEPTTEPDPDSGVLPPTDADVAARRRGKPKAPPGMVLSQDIQQLLGLGDAASLPEFAGTADLDDVDTPLSEMRVGRRRRAPPASADGTPIPRLSQAQQEPLLAATPAQLLAEHMALWHSAAMARLPDRDAAVKAYGDSVLAALRDARVEQKTIDRIGFAFGAMRDAAALMDLRMREIRGRLAQPDTLDSLQSRGLTAHNLLGPLYRGVNRHMRTLQQQALEGRAVFPLVPTARQMFDTALVQAGREHARYMADVAHINGFIDAPTPPPPPVPTTTALPTTPVALPGSHGHPPITNRQQALGALERFMAGRKTLLPQFGGSLGDAGELSTGVVRFRNAYDMASTFPCAASLTQVTLRYDTLPNLWVEPLKYWKVVYPGGENEHLRAVPRSGEINGRVAITARSADGQHVRFSPDGGVTWIDTDIYTDAAVEEEKTMRWKAVFEEAFPLSFTQWSYAHIT